MQKVSKSALVGLSAIALSMALIGCGPNPVSSDAVGAAEHESAVNAKERIPTQSWASIQNNINNLKHRIVSIRSAMVPWEFHHQQVRANYEKEIKACQKEIKRLLAKCKGHCRG